MGRGPKRQNPGANSDPGGRLAARQTSLWDASAGASALAEIVNPSEQFLIDTLFDERLRRAKTLAYGDLYDAFERNFPDLDEDQLRKEIEGGIQSLLARDIIRGSSEGGVYSLSPDVEAALQEAPPTPSREAVSASHSEEQGLPLHSTSALGAALAESFGTPPEKGKGAIASKIAERSLQALAGSLGAAAIFGTPLLPVAGALMAGYLAAKSSQAWRERKRIKKARKEEGLAPRSVTPETVSRLTKAKPVPKDIDPAKKEREKTEVEEDRLREEEERLRQEIEDRERIQQEAFEKRQNALAEKSESVRNFIRQDALGSLDREILEELREEGLLFGDDFGEDRSDEEIEARKILLASESKRVNPDERSEVVAAVAELERNYLKKGILQEALAEIKAERADIEKSAKAAEKEQIANMSTRVDRQLAEAKAGAETELRQQKDILAIHEGNLQLNLNPTQRAEEEKRAEEIKSSISQIEKSLSDLETTAHSVREENSQNISNYIQSQKEARLAFIQEEEEALLGDAIGDLDGRAQAGDTDRKTSEMVNLTTRTGQLACRRCGRVPKTVRRRCSRCGLPFMLDEESMRYCGKNDSDLEAMGKLELLEKYEGDADLRKEKRDSGRVGHRLVVRDDQRLVVDTNKKSNNITRFGSDGEPISSSPRTKKGKRSRGASGEAKKAEDTSSPSSSSSSGDHSSLLRKGLDGSLEDYVAMRNEARKASGRVLRISGKGKFGKEQLANMPEKKDQASCVVDGEFPLDFNSFSKESGNLLDVQGGDRVLIRQNTNCQYGGEKNRQRVIGYADVAKTVSHSFSEEELSDPQGVKDKLAEIWDENNLGEIQSIFTRDQFVDYNADKVLHGEGDVPKPCPHFSLVLYENEQRLDTPIENPGKSNSESQKHLLGPMGGGSPLEPEKDPELYEDIANATYAKDHEVGLDKNGKPVVCGVLTAAGSPCRNYVSRGRQYCWQHRGGPRKDESALSKEEMVASQEEALRQVRGESTAPSGNQESETSRENAPGSGIRIPRGREAAEVLINRASNDLNTEQARECGMTEQELYRYANAYLEACNPKEGEVVVVQVAFENQRVFAEAIEDIAKARDMEISVWYPDKATAQQYEEIRNLEGSGRAITGYLDDVGGFGERIEASLRYSDGDPITFAPSGNRWNQTMVPTREWAEYLSANHELTGFSSDPEEAFRQLAEDLQSFTYSDRGVSGLRDHLEELERRAGSMNDLGVQEVTISSPPVAGPGTETELSMRMLDGSRWMTVDMPSGGGDDVLANTATEEVWGTPDPNSLQGKFTSSKPLNFTGTAGPDRAPVVAEQVRGEFKDGQLVKLQAYKQDSQGEWVKDAAVQAEMDRFFFGGERPEGAPYPQCGELGVVDSENRVAQTGRNYLIPMIDEHGGLHIAIGDSYKENGGGKDNGGSHTGKGTPWENVHVDVPIGNSTTSMQGKTRDGQVVDILNKGSFSI